MRQMGLQVARNVTASGPTEGKTLLSRINMRWHELLESLREGGFRNVLEKRVYFNKTVMPVEMDLGSLAEENDPLSGKPYDIIELTTGMISGGAFRFAAKSRRLKAVHNLKKGFRGYFLARDDLIVGDIWCACPPTPEGTVSHSDMDWLGIDSQPGEVYTFDMFIVPDERGHNIAAPFQMAALHALKYDGFRKAYGFYRTDYLPALWVHRLLKWKERGGVRVWRFLSLRGSSPV